MTEPNRRIQAVTFDAAGTLFKPAEPVGALYARHAVAHGLKPAPDLETTLDARFREAFRQMPAPAYEPGAAERNAAVDRAWWKRLVAQVTDDLGPFDFEAFFDAVYLAFADAATWRTFPETLGVLGTLRQAGVPVAIVSNFDARLLGICRGLGVASQVDAIVYSADLGVSKPDAAIFHNALGRLGTKPGVTVHVGDSYREDVGGARAAGLQAVYLKRGASADSVEGDVLTVRDLAEFRRTILG